MRLEKGKLETALEKLNAPGSLDAEALKDILDGAHPEFRKKIFKKYGIIHYSEADNSLCRMVYVTESGHMPKNACMILKRYLSEVDERPTEYFLLHKTIEDIPAGTKEALLWSAKMIMRNQISGYRFGGTPPDDITPDNALEVIDAIEEKIGTVSPGETAYQLGELIMKFDEGSHCVPFHSGWIDWCETNGYFTDRENFIMQFFEGKDYSTEKIPPSEIQFMAKCASGITGDDDYLYESGKKISESDVRKSVGPAREIVKELLAEYFTESEEESEDAIPGPESPETREKETENEIREMLDCLVRSLNQCGKLAEALMEKIK